MPFDIKLATVQDTTPFVFSRLSCDPEKPITLHVRHLGTLNARYMDAAFTRARVTGDKGSEQFAEILEHDLADIAAFCVARWENVTDNGEPVECTPEKALAFLKFALANGYIDDLIELRIAALTTANYRAPVASGGDLGKE